VNDLIEKNLKNVYGELRNYDGISENKSPEDSLNVQSVGDHAS
jgi:hypothetical protein